VRSLQRRAVERAAAVLRLRAATLRADVRRTVGAVLHEEQLDAPVGRRLQRLLPARRSATVPRRLLAPPLEQLLLTAGTPLVEQRPRTLEQPRRVDMRLRPDPADERGARLRSQELLEAGAGLLRPRENDADVAQPPHAAVERPGDVAKVTVDDRLDVPLVAPLRPAALVVAAGNLGGLVRERDQLAVAEPVDVAALASDVRDEGAVAATDEADERSEVELGRDPRLVLHRQRQGQREEQVVEPGSEYGDAARALPAELLLEPTPDPLEILLERPALVVPELASQLLELALGSRVHRPSVRREIPGRRHLARSETDVEADGASLRAPERRELPQLLPRDRTRHA